MGIQDRDYYKDDEPGGFQMRPPRSMVTTIIIINAVLYLVDLFLFPNNALMYTLAFDVHSLTKPWMWWQLVTAGFAHDPTHINHILFNMLGLWFMGREVERMLGHWEFLRFYLAAIVVGSLATGIRYYFFVPQPEWPISLGASGAVIATVLLYVFNFPRRTLILLVIPMPAWLVGVLFVALDVLGAAGYYFPMSGDVEYSKRIAYDVHLSGVAFAFLYFRFRMNFGALVPQRLVDAVRGVGRRLKGRPNLRVHRGQEDPNAEEQYRQLDEEADRILAKLSRDGEASLTDKERRVLEDYSRRMRQKHR